MNRFTIPVVAVSICAALVLAVSTLTAEPVKEPAPVVELEKEPVPETPVAPKPPVDEAKAKLVLAALAIADNDLETGFKRAQEGLQFHTKKNYMDAGWKYVEAIRHNPADSTSVYNLACAMSLMGEEDAAAKCLDLSIRLGFRDYDHILKDPDFDPVRKTETFKTLFANLETFRERRGGVTGKDHVMASGIFLRYRVITPVGYDGVTPYPVVLALHGLGGNLESFSVVTHALKEAGAIVVVPNAPYAIAAADDVIGYSWWIGAPNQEEEKAPRTLVQSMAASRHHVEKVMEEVIGSYAIDPKRTYVMGFSQGAFMAYSAGLSGKNIFSGVLVAGGWLPPIITDRSLEASKKVKCFVAHGADDKPVPFEKAQEALTRLTEAGLNVSFRKYKAGHELNEKMLKDMADWIRKN